MCIFIRGSIVTQEAAPQPLYHRFGSSSCRQMHGLSVLPGTLVSPQFKNTQLGKSVLLNCLKGNLECLHVKVCLVMEWLVTLSVPFFAPHHSWDRPQSCHNLALHKNYGRWMDGYYKSVMGVFSLCLIHQSYTPSLVWMVSNCSI